VDGTHYHFSTRDVMMVSVLLLLLLLLLLVLMPHDSPSPSPPLSPSSQAMKEANEFVETAQVHANMYGTSKRAVQVTSAALARDLHTNSLPSRRALLPKVLPLHRHEVSAVESKLLSCFFFKSSHNRDQAKFAFWILTFRVGAPAPPPPTITLVTLSACILT
jgi:hypothetical protein